MEELLDAAHQLRHYVDISTVRPGARNTAEWTKRVERYDAACCAVKARA
jgi:hypothetical protein